MVRASILLEDPFPPPGRARISVNELFHEAVTTECKLNGLILEPGKSLPQSNRFSVMTRLHIPVKQDTRGLML